MYRYKGCTYEFAHRITGDGYETLMRGIDMFAPSPNEPLAWDEGEDDLLIKMYRENASISQIADTLERSEESITARKHSLQKMGKLEKRPSIRITESKYRFEFIKKHYQTKRMEYCCKKLGLARKTVTEYARQLGVGLKIGEPVRFWTEEELKFLKENYVLKGFRYCSKELNRSKSAVCSKAFKLDIRLRHPNYSKYRAA